MRNHWGIRLVGSAILLYRLIQMASKSNPPVLSFSVPKCKQRRYSCSWHNRDKNVIIRQRDSCLRVDLRPSENWVMMSCCSLGFILQINWRAYLSNIASGYTPVYEESLRIQIFDLLALLPNLRSSKPGNLKVFCLHKG